MARIAIITGAASGIGRALASALVARGDTVVVADVDGDGAERAAGELVVVNRMAARQLVWTRATLPTGPPGLVDAGPAQVPVPRKGGGRDD